VAFEGLQAWWPGMTEQDLAHRLADSFAALGGDKLTMLSVTAGERTTMLNGDATDRPIRQGDVVRIDVIGTVGNYYCDVARTAVVGVADPQLDDLWAKLVLCRDEALAMIRPGASTQAIYRRYVERLERWGLPVFHFLGHGLGLTLHEEPYLNRFSDIVLVPGMVLAVEPLVVLDQVGLQLEEAVVVTEDGYELLTGRHDLRQLWRMAEVVRQ
jgi:Xaa-Pro dipeptidase